MTPQAALDYQIVRYRDMTGKPRLALALDLRECGLHASPSVWGAGLDRAAKDVLLHKPLWHRMSTSDRQLVDAAGFLAVGWGKLEQSYLRTWAGVLDLSPVLEDLLAGRIGPKQS